MKERELTTTALEPPQTRGLVQRQGIGMLHVYSKVRQVLDIASYSTYSLEQVVYTTVPQLGNLSNLRSQNSDQLSYIIRRRKRTPQ